MTGGAGSAPDAGAFRTAMGRWATGVSIVTASEQGRDAGLTVNALLSVSLRPPSVLVSLSRDVDTLPVLERTRTFGVSVLRADQRELSERFALPIPSAEKFGGVAVRRGRSGVPLLEGALATLECRVVSTNSVFDHHLVVGEVTDLELGEEGSPLVFFRSGYAAADGANGLRLPPASGSRP